MLYLTINASGDDVKHGSKKKRYEMTGRFFYAAITIQTVRVVIRFETKVCRDRYARAARKGLLNESYNFTDISWKVARRMKARQDYISGREGEWLNVLYPEIWDCETWSVSKNGEKK